MLNKLPEKTKKIKKFIFNEASSSHNASTQMGEKLFEFVTEPLWIFCISGSQWNVMLVMYISTALGINRLTRVCILYFDIATQDAGSGICECHQSRISLRTF